jgi:hypothetical protein
VLRAKRRNRYARFPRHANQGNLVLLTALFLSGLAISRRLKRTGIAVYLILWALSYYVIYAGTCRHCPYYGKRCPIPLEGGLVNSFCAPGSQRFGYAALFWALIAYLLRTMLPASVMLHDRLLKQGSAYFGILAAFWVNHLFIEGCPNCINTACPLNPEYQA